MAKIAPFEQFPDAYEAWFERFPLVYEAELRAVRRFTPRRGPSLEIGVGSGRFAAPLGVTWGVDPSPRMLALARQRGLRVVAGVAEHLPFARGVFRWALVVTTLCFVDDARAMMAEAHRVLQPGGRLIIGLVDRESPIGRLYQARKEEDVFYREATFFSAADVWELMRAAGFRQMAAAQTLFGPLEEVTSAEPVKPGWGEGSFVVITGVTP
jgi:SAM-dependent methyltransferase